MFMHTSIWRIYPYLSYNYIRLQLEFRARVKSLIYKKLIKKSSGSSMDSLVFSFFFFIYFSFFAFVVKKKYPFYVNKK